MGIPSYFNFILRNHKSIIGKKNLTKSHYLFVDANSLIYDSINELNEIESNNQIYEEVLHKLEELIKVVNPSEKTYICFDGIPPYPKMYQQRQRRFKSILTKEILNQKSNKWNSNQITPGTDFMNGLDYFLIDKFKKNKKILFSGSNEEMEGEHKICKFIKESPSIFKDKNIIIYGLDADLIMLGLLLNINYNIFLYKETHHFNYIGHIDKEEHYYFNISKLAVQIDILLNNQNTSQSIYDYCFICFLCGNDFLPHLPSINLRNNGINILIEKYLELNKNIIHLEKKTINWEHFRQYVLLLESCEQDKIKENLKWKIELENKTRIYNYEDKLNYLPCVDNEKEHFILKNMDEYNNYILENHNIKNICLNYLQMLEWTWYYYNGKNINNTIYYYYSYGPLFNDLKSYIPIFNEQRILIEKPYKLININTLLYFVLPYHDHKTIIPNEIYKKTSDILYKYIPLLKETNYDTEYFLCKFFWECHLNMKYIDIYKINNYLNNA